ncbi:MAG TPA: DUF222 domain-containing protein [Kineosporiaceae bacterium]|nr:DUF222 domain-containing protein [Kineosporiaceae bacterium]
MSELRMDRRLRNHHGHTVDLVLPRPRPAPDRIDPGADEGTRVDPILRPDGLSASCSGIALAAAKTALPALSDYDLVEELARAHNISASWYAHQLTTLARLYHRPVMSPPSGEPPGRRKQLSREDVTVAEIAPKLHLSDDAARRLLHRALTLTSRLPHTLALLKSGRLDEPRAHALADLIGKMADWVHSSALAEDPSPRNAEHAATALASMVEHHVLKRAATQRTDQLRDCTRRAIARIAPAYAATLHQDTTATRDVFISHHGQEDGMGFLGAHLPIIETKACWAALTSRAHQMRDRGDLRTLDQLRADALVQAILNPGPLFGFITNSGAKLDSDSSADSSSSPGSSPGTSSGAGAAFGRGPRTDTWPAKDVARGVTAHVQVTVSIETLLNLNDDPAHLTGHGTITAQTARALAFQPDSTWRRLLTDPQSGTLLDYGRTKYRPPTPLADHVIARDLTCTHPDCTQPAENCDLDHLLAFPLGATCECNLHPRCRRHHRIKHETLWSAAHSTDNNDPEGTLISTSPTGHTYKTHRQPLTEPSPRAPSRTPAPDSAPKRPPGDEPPF